MTSLESKVAGGIAARQCLELLRGEIPPGNTDAARGAAHAVEDWHRAWCVEWGLAPPADTRPAGALSDSDLRAFEREPMPFGKHQGTPIGQVPLEYLDWLIGEQELFTRKVREYLKRWNDEWKESFE